MRTPAIDRWLRAILIVGFVARLMVIHERLPRPLQGDESSYDSIAFNVATGHGYVAGSSAADYQPTAARGPGYVLFVAAFYRVFGHHTLPPLVAQAVIDMIAAWLVVRLARRWFRDPRVALLAGAGFAFYPPFLLNAALLMTETTSQFAVVTSVLLFVDHVRTRRVSPLIWSGVALGYCTLSKPQLAPIGIVLGLCSLGVLTWRAAARAAVTATLVVGLVLAPWILRNAIVFHAFIPGVSIGGVGLWLGSGPYGGRPIGAVDDPAVPDSIRTRLHAMSELELNRWAFAEARRVVAADPMAYARVTLRKIPRLWLNLGFEGHAPSRASWFVAAFNAAMIALAVVGARSGLPEPPAAAALVGLALFWTIVYVPFFTVVRYAHPYYALLFPFTAAGVLALARRGPSGRAFRLAS